MNIKPRHAVVFYVRVGLSNHWNGTVRIGKNLERLSSAIPTNQSYIMLHNHTLM